MTNTILSLRNLKKRFGTAVPADGFSIDIYAGEFFTMLGPSGSGKSTVLRMIAGLETPDSGEIIINGTDMTHTPPWGRGLGMVFQQYANFPHMKVEVNVAYGLRRTQLSKTDVAKRVTELLEMVGLGGFEDRKVTQLSGGEQQRVAIARALAPSPTLLLLDEPLSALDEKIRREMQVELRGIQEQTGTTFIYVTHDQEEALTMSDRIAVLNEGRYVQCDSPGEIFQRPRTPFVADFFRGSNILNATFEEIDGVRSINVSGATVKLPQNARKNDIGKIAVRGEAILLNNLAESSDLKLSGMVTRVTYRGLYTNYDLKLYDEQTLVATQSGRSEIKEGQIVEVGISADDITVLEAD